IGKLVKGNAHAYTGRSSELRRSEHLNGAAGLPRDAKLKEYPMSQSARVPLSAMLILCPIISAQAQDLPAGPGKETVSAACGSCHDVNRIRAGYTPDGWRSVIQMMKNVDAPVPKDQWETVTEYLIKNFPEKPRPPAAVIDGPVQA